MKIDFKYKINTQKKINGLFKKQEHIQNLNHRAHIVTILLQHPLQLVYYLRYRYLYNLERSLHKIPGFPRS